MTSYKEMIRASMRFTSSFVFVQDDLKVYSQFKSHNYLTALVFEKEKQSK